MRSAGELRLRTRLRACRVRRSERDGGFSTTVCVSGRHLDGCRVAVGETFSFGVNLFLRAPETPEYFAKAFAGLAREGLGPGRSRCELVRYEAPPLVLSLAATKPVKGVRVEFLTPTELKHDQKVVDVPLFPALFGRAQDRVAALRRLYGTHPLAVDFAAMRLRSADVRLVDYRFVREDVDRTSSRTGQTHGVGGFRGFAEYEGDLTEFAPYLRAATYTGVGRHAVWGNGEISTAER